MIARQSSELSHILLHDLKEMSTDGVAEVSLPWEDDQDPELLLVIRYSEMLNGCLKDWPQEMSKASTRF